MSDVVATFDTLRRRLENFTRLPLYWPNDDRTPDLGSASAPNGYVYSEIRVLDEGPASLGDDDTRLHRDTGEMVVYVNVPRGSRAGTAEAYAQEIRALFKMTVLTGIVVTRRTIDFGQPVESSDGRLWSVPVRIEWFADRLDNVDYSDTPPGALLWNGEALRWNGEALTWKA